jgi:hypothetical protein
MSTPNETPRSSSPASFVPTEIPAIPDETETQTTTLRPQVEQIGEKYLKEL